MLVNERKRISRGCYACICRKVKCDEGKPSCERCRRGKRHCPGYRNQDELQFRNAQIFRPSIASGFWRQEIMPCFVAHFLLPASGSIPGRTNFVMDLLASPKSENVAFNDAILATATAYFYQRHKKSELRVEALQSYVTALGSLHAAMTGTERVIDDSTLAAVSLLSLRDFITGECTSTRGLHDEAELHVLRASPANGEILNSRAAHINSMVRIGNAIRGLWLPDLVPHLVPSDWPDTPNDFCSLITLANEVCTASRRFSFVQGSQESYLAITNQMICIEEQMRGLIKRMFEQSPFRTVSYDDRRALPGYALDHALIFTQVHNARSWILVWCTHLKFLDSLALVAVRFNRNALFEFMEPLAQRMELVNRICAVVPYMLGEVDSRGHATCSAMNTIAPGSSLCAAALYVAGCNTTIRSMQRAWILDRLKYIGHDRAIGQALSFARNLEMKFAI